MYTNNNGICNYPDKFVYDNAKILSDKEENELENLIKEYTNTKDYDLVILTEVSNSYSEYENRTFYEEGYNSGNFDKDVIMLYIHMGIREVVIESFGSLEDKVKRDELDKINDAINDDMRDAEYFNACVDFLSDANKAINITFIGKIFSVILDNFLGASIAGLIIAVLICTGLTKQLNSAKPEKSAGNYLNSLNLKLSEDKFLYSNTTKVRIQTSKSSSSGGGSSSGGSRSSRSF